MGDVLPDFTLADVRGHRHALSEPGRWGYTVLWFTNLCEDCRSRIPLLEELHSEKDGRFRVLAVSILEPADPLPLEVGRRCPFPFLLDPDDVTQRRLGLAHPPGACPLHNLYILDRKGRVVYRHHLSALSPEAFRKLRLELQR